MITIQKSLLSLKKISDLRCFVVVSFDRFLTRFRPNVFRIEIQIPGRMDSSTNCLYFTVVRRVKKGKKNYLLNIAQIKVSSIFKSSFMQRNGNNIRS